MAAGDVANLRVVGRYQDQNIVNNLSYRVVSQAETEADIWQTLADAWETQMAAGWLAQHSLQYELVGIKVFTEFGDNKPPGFSASGLFGDRTGDPQESYVCRTITLYTEAGNPRIRGRIMLSGGTEDMFADADGQVLPTEVDFLTTLGKTLNAPLIEGSNEFQLCVWNSLGNISFDIIKEAGRSTPSVQRSRRVRQYLIG